MTTRGTESGVGFSSPCTCIALTVENCRSAPVMWIQGRRESVVGIGVHAVGHLVLHDSEAVIAAEVWSDQRLYLCGYDRSA
jgi:hypothetical protein